MPFGIVEADYKCCSNVISSADLFVLDTDYTKVRALDDLWR